ncbi:response regulator [Candidatus Bipolaricaulota bacterium]|nr:response regulator [Candidatus Bipolaricaulota bacterium]MBS3814192.1 response regulator [Candidatus Bipolaricaulota bacterium]
MTKKESTFSIFLIEDRDDDIDITREALNQAKKSCTLEVAKEGEEALKRLREKVSDKRKSLPEMILLDLNLPKMDGQKVLEELKDDDQLAPVPVIILTISKQDKDVARSYNSGAAGYITKPIDFSEFVKTIDVINQYWSICQIPEQH